MVRVTNDNSAWRLIFSMSVRLYMVSHLYFFSKLNKEPNSSYLQLRRRLNGKMLVLGVVHSKSASIVQQKMRKNQHVKRLRFSLNTSQHMYTKKCPIKIACSRPCSKFLFPHRYKTVSIVYNKNTSKWSSNAQILSKYELYTYKPSQLHETVQQKCHCKNSYGTTFDYYDPEAMSQWCDTIYYKQGSDRTLPNLCLLRLKSHKSRRCRHVGDSQFFVSPISSK